MLSIKLIEVLAQYVVLVTYDMLQSSPVVRVIKFCLMDNQLEVHCGFGMNAVHCGFGVKTCTKIRKTRAMMLECWLIMIEETRTQY